MYLNHDEEQVIYSLLLEKSLLLSSKQIELLKNDKGDTPEYANAKSCYRIIDGIIKQIEDLRELSPYKNKHI